MGNVVFWLLQHLARFNAKTVWRTWPVHEHTQTQMSTPHTNSTFIFNSNTETTNNQQQTEKNQQWADKKQKDWPALARSRQVRQRKSGWRTRPRLTGWRKRKHSGFNLRLHTKKKTSVSARSPRNLPVFALALSAWRRWLTAHLSSLSYTSLVTLLCHGSLLQIRSHVVIIIIVQHRCRRCRLLLIANLDVPRVSVVIRVMLDVAPAEARFQPEPAPAVWFLMRNFRNLIRTSLVFV